MFFKIWKLGILWNTVENLYQMQKKPNIIVKYL